MQLDSVPKRFPKFFASTPLASASKNASISSEPVDAFIQRLTEGQETIIEQNYTGALDPSYAILRAQEQQRLPPLEMYKLTGQPIEWPQFIERFRDQVHNKSTLTDGDRMAYLYQHLEGEAKKAVESLGVSGHSYPAALKTLKKLFGNHHRVTAANLKKMVDGPIVPLNDRHSLRNYYYQVKACVTWCSKLGKTGMLNNPEYLSRAALRLPGNLRVRWYESIGDRYDTVTLRHFEQWLEKRVETLFNPFEDYIHEDMKGTRSYMRQAKTRPMPSPPRQTLHPFSLNTKVQQRGGYSVPPKKYVSGGKERCSLCPARHRLIYCDEYKAKPIKERKRIVFDQQLCFNCLKSEHGVNECPSDNRCWKSGCGQKHHSLLHEDAELKPTQQMDRQHTEGDGSRSNVNQVKVQPFKRVALQILPVKVRGSNATISTYAVLDAGSDSTLIRKDLADELQLDGDMHQPELTTVGSDPTSNEFKCVSFELSSDSHPTSISVDGAWVISNMDIPVFQYSKERASSRWKHLEGIDLPDLRGDGVKLLIGSDMAHLLLHLDTRRGRQDEPIAVKTQLGWTLFGSISYKHGKRLHLNTASISQGDTIHQSLERFWEMDSYG